MEIYKEAMCRICLEDYQDDFKYIFAKKNNQSQLSSIGHLYQELLLPIHYEPAEPQYICLICSKKLKEFHQFKTIAIESHAKFTLVSFPEMKIESEDEFVVVIESDDNKTHDFIGKIEYLVPEKEEEDYISDPLDSKEKESFNSPNDNKGSTESIAIEVIKFDERQDLLDEEIESDEKLEIHKCNDCNITFKSKWARTKHRSEQHKQIKYKCSQCPKNFLIEELLNVHMRTHRGLAPYECKPCNRSFNYRRNYLTHLELHRNEKNIQCHLCGKRFSTNGTMKIHLRVHNDERPYDCETCGKKFRMLSHMKAHTYTHRKKSLACDICGRTYTAPHSLKSHIEDVHENVVRYKCHICEKIFNRKYLLIDHLRTHPGLTEDEIAANTKNRCAKYLI